MVELVSIKDRSKEARIILLGKLDHDSDGTFLLDKGEKTLGQIYK